VTTLYAHFITSYRLSI